MPDGDAHCALGVGERVRLLIVFHAEQLRLHLQCPAEGLRRGRLFLGDSLADIRQLGHYGRDRLIHQCRVGFAIGLPFGLRRFPGHHHFEGLILLALLRRHFYCFHIDSVCWNFFPSVGEHHIEETPAVLGCIRHSADLFNDFYTLHKGVVKAA